MEIAGSQAGTERPPHAAKPPAENGCSEGAADVELTAVTQVLQLR